MATHKEPLSDTEEAFVAMVFEEHRANLANADAIRDRRLSHLYRDKHVPNGVVTNFTQREGDGPAHMTYEVPDIPQPVADAPVDGAA